MIDSKDNNKLEEKIFDAEINIIRAIQEIIRDSRSLEEADIKIKEFKNMIEHLYYFKNNIRHIDCSDAMEKISKVVLKETIDRAMNSIYKKEY